VPLKSKSRPAVKAAFQSVLKDTKYSKPLHRQTVGLQSDIGKEYLNRTFQDMLKRDGLQFHVCRNTVLKCAVVERAH